MSKINKFIEVNKKISKKLCVYCGSNIGGNKNYSEVAKRLGEGIVNANLGLVYGGGGNGLMGIVAKAVKAKGGHVTGIIPTSLLEIENAFDNVDERHIVSNYHERKMLMYKLSSGFIALPGGPGTLEELVEQLAWSESEYHSKPIIIVNTNGYWEKLIELLSQMHRRLLINLEPLKQYIIVNEPEEAIEQFIKM